MSEDVKANRRKRRTRKALIDAFNDLVLTHRRREIKVHDVVLHADVGRSTFYEHYSSADELHLHAIAAPLAILADAVCGKTGEKPLVWLLEHFWENRARARQTFGGRLGPRISRLLAELVAARLDEAGLSLPIKLAAVQLAEAPLAAIKAWVGGEAACSAADLAAAIINTSAAARASLALQP